MSSPEPDGAIWARMERARWALLSGQDYVEEQDGVRYTIYLDRDGRPHLKVEPIEQGE